MPEGGRFCVPGSISAGRENARLTSLLLASRGSGMAKPVRRVDPEIGGTGWLRPGLDPPGAHAPRGWPSVGERQAFALPSTRGRRFDLVDLRRDGRALLLFVPYTGG